MALSCPHAYRFAKSGIYLIGKFLPRPLRWHVSSKAQLAKRDFVVTFARVSAQCFVRKFFRQRNRGVKLRILLVEDDVAISRVLVNGLKAERFAVDLVSDGEEALVYMTEVNYDLVILDVGLPKLDGITVLKQARKKQIRVPVMILSAQASVDDRVRGLEAGADDYVQKPFAFEEVLARVRALMRRPAILQDKLTVADLEIDRTRHIVKRAGKQISLTQREYALLEYLMRNAGHPVSRTMVVEHVWNLGFEGLTNIVDVYINYLRAKIDNGFERKLIHTARGFGYMLTEQGQEAVERC